MRVVDLTGPLAPGMWHYGAPFLPFEQETIATVQSHGFRATRLGLTTHMGTHMDTPGHWWDGTEGADTMSLDACCGPGVTLQVGDDWGPLTAVTEDDLRRAGGEDLKPGDVAVILTGWHRHWFDAAFASSTPYLSREATAYLIAKRVRLVATDTALCCDPREGETRVKPGVTIPDHMLLEAGIPYVNGIVPAEPLPASGYTVCALPLKVVNGDGSPVRAVALFDV